ncbi:MAG TPA: MerR family transcriptional regulator [Bacteroidales bacterium]|nr:MerR family transcriptional regulator [Bacteroidales bacterium]
MDRYTLNDLEKLTGIMSGTIRIWERRFRIIKPHRTETNRRWYDDDDLKRILNIAVLYRSGIKISKIATLTGAEIEAKVASITREADNPEINIDSLIIAMTTFNEKGVNEVLLRSIISIGFEKTFTDLVFPFLKRVGILWHTGSVNVGAEHFVSSLFRLRIISATDALPPAANPKRQRALLFLPENELHEIGLLFFTYIIRSMGHEVLYLGQSTPLNAIHDVIDKWEPDTLVTGALSALPFTSPEEYLILLGKTFPEKRILVSGELTNVMANSDFPNIFAVRSVDELKSHFSQVTSR